MTAIGKKFVVGVLLSAVKCQVIGYHEGENEK